jgi:hypothetical protein
VLTIKKTMKKTKPKFLFELIFILFINFVINNSQLFIEFLDFIKYM